MTLSEKPTGSGHRESQSPGLLLMCACPPQLAASAKRGCVMGTATVRTTRTRRTVRPWPAGLPHIPVPTTPPSACPLTSCVMAKTTAEMARTRASCAVSGVRARPRGVAASWPAQSVGRGLGQERAGCRVSNSVHWSRAAVALREASHNSSIYSTRWPSETVTVCLQMRRKRHTPLWVSVQSHTTPRTCREGLVQSHTTPWVLQKRGRLELLTWNRPPHSLLNRKSRLEVRYRVEQTSGGREFNRVPRNEQNVQNEGEGTGSGSAKATGVM